MNSVPENWIPFIPVHVPGNNRQIPLQRAAMPRILDGDPNPPVKVQPRTMLLREGLDKAPPQTYFIHKEEVSRAGARLTQAFQRTRWTDGSVYTWLLVRRQTGRGRHRVDLVLTNLSTFHSRVPLSRRPNSLHKQGATTSLFDRRTSTIRLNWAFKRAKQV
jgi:hypothetical protein